MSCRFYNRRPCGEEPRTLIRVASYKNLAGNANKEVSRKLIVILVLDKFNVRVAQNWKDLDKVYFRKNMMSE